jgi:predicted DNA-binding transcriptional regulator
MVIWMFSFIAGPVLLAGYLGYIFRGRRPPRLTEQCLREMQVLDEIERLEDLR